MEGSESEFCLRVMLYEMRKTCRDNGMERAVKCDFENYILINITIRFDL